MFLLVKCKLPEEKKVEIFESLIKHFVSVHNITKVIDLTSSSIYQWKRIGVPVDRAVQIQELTNGEIKAKDLRPDVFK